MTVKNKYQRWGAKAVPNPNRNRKGPSGPNKKKKCKKMKMLAKQKGLYPK